MRRLIQVCYLFIYPVNGKRILYEVIRAYAEEIRFLRKYVDGKRRGRYLYHGTGLYFVVEGNLLSAQL